MSTKTKTRNALKLINRKYKALLHKLIKDNGGKQQNHKKSEHHHNRLYTIDALMQKSN